MRWRSLAGLAAFAAMAGPAGAQTNLITNGSFESGLAGWTTTAADQQSGDCLGPTAAAVVSPGFSGSNALSLTNTDCLLGVGQDFATVPGDYYTTTFWAQIVGTPPADADPSSWYFGAPSDMGVYINGLGCGRSAPYPSGWFFAMTCSTHVTSTTGRVSLVAFNDYGSVQIDSVIVQHAYFDDDGNVIPYPDTAPEPASLMLLATGLVGLAPFAHRRRR